MSLLARVSALSPFGPIFGKELRTTSRRKRSYFLRVGYLGLLLLTLLVAWAMSGRSYGGLAAQAAQQAELGLMFFMCFAMFSVCAMGLIGPVLTSTAIGSERLAKTLPVLLMTPISSWQIIAGKLFSRLLAALTLLGLSLPVLALVRLLGGVELRQMLAVICICTSFVLSCAAIGLFYSTFINRAYAVILLSYATLGFLYGMVPWILVEGLDMDGRSEAWIIAWTNPVFATATQVEPKMSRFFPDSWIACVIGQLLLTAVLVALCGMSLRRIARRSGEQASAVNPESYIPLAGVAIPEALPPVQVPGAPPPPPMPMATPTAMPGPSRPAVLPYSAAGTRLAPVHRPREVSDNPILWREIRRPLLPRTWQKVLATVICIGLLLLTYALLADENDLDEPDSHTGYAAVFHGLMWLLTAVLSATVIAGEKESDTWTLLLSTPVSGAAVVWSKVAGLFRRILWPTVLVFAHFALFTLFGVVHPLAAVLMLWITLTFNSVWIATGVYLSLRMRRVTFAVITNLMLAVLVYALPFVLLLVYTEARTGGDDETLEHAAWHVPYYYLGVGMHDLNYAYGDNAGYRSRSTHEYEGRFQLPGFSTRWRGGSYDEMRGLSGVEYGCAVFLIGAVHLAIAFGILAWTASAFDGIVGRAGRHVHLGAFDTDDAVAPVPAESPPGPAIPAPGTAVDDAVFADFWRRALAAGVDALLLSVTGAVLGLVAGFVAMIAQVEHDSSEPPAAIVGSYVLWGLAAALPLGWLYGALFESSRWRATPGKSLAGVFVTDSDGRRLSFPRAALRQLAKLFSAAPLGAGYVAAAFTRRKQALHDLLAGSVVLRR